MLAIDPLIPRHVFWADPDKSLVKTSLDGRYLSYLAPAQANLQLWLAPIDAWRTAQVVSANAHPVRNYWWASTHDHLLYIHDQFGDENWQLKGYQLSSGKTITYTPEGLQVDIIRISNKLPEKILIGLNKRDS